jgi:RNA polymerase sigma-70 factor (ECF subfamily)
MNHFAVVVDRSAGCCSLSRAGAGVLVLNEWARSYGADLRLKHLAGFSGALLLQMQEREDRGGVDSLADENSDQALIDACMTHDNNSFAKLVERYEAAVTGILWHFTRDRLVLEELVQDTFVEAYFSLRRFRKGAPFLPWLRTIATRVGYRKWRQRRQDLTREARLAERPRPTLPRPSDTAEYVYRVLELLDPKDRLVLTLQYFEGCSTKEIAERMGWTLATVKVRAFRARKKLRALLVEAEQISHEER